MVVVHLIDDNPGHVAVGFNHQSSDEGSNWYAS